MSVDRRTAWPYDEHGEPSAFVYQRYAHPTGTAAEEALGALAREQLARLTLLRDGLLRARVARLAAQLLQPLELLCGRLVRRLLLARHRAERT